MSTASAATVANVFASNATATFPPASRSAMIPEPMTAAASTSEPTPFGKQLAAHQSGVSGHPPRPIE